MARTPYAETEVLLAFLEGRDEDGERIVGEMTQREQNSFARALRRNLAAVEAATPFNLDGNDA